MQLIQNMKNKNSIDINQEGIENELILEKKTKTFNFSNFTKVEKIMVKHNLEDQIYLTELTY